VSAINTLLFTGAPKIECCNDVASVTFSRGMRILFALALTLCFGISNHAVSAAPVIVDHYIDPAQQTAVWFGARSHWLQPWRAYCDTVPTSVLRNAIGINFNVPASEANAVAEHLAKNGFRRVRIEFGWGGVSWDHPDQLADPATFDTYLTACKRWKLRPLLLLNANSGVPCPAKFYDVRLTKPAVKGDTVIHVDPQSLSDVVPGRSGLSNLTDYWAAEDIFTKINPNGEVTLSKPLPKDLPAGNVPAATLKYLPFYPSKLKSGEIPTQFTETMRGWLDYVKAVTTEAKKVLGTEGKPNAGFDVEIWNELTFGSHFLDINQYYQQPVAVGDSAIDAIRAQTVAYIRDPRNDLPGVGIGDGFDNQWPWGAGSTAPPGLTALDKHPYPPMRRFPEDQQFNGVTPLNALGKPAGSQVKPNEWRDDFIPAYTAYFPEYYLSAIQTETIIRDISPITTDIYGTKHGRYTHPDYPNGKPAPAPTMWITEVNMDPSGLKLSTGDVGVADRMKAKALLRFLTCFVNKGVQLIDFFAVQDNNPVGLGLVSPSFLNAVKADENRYPPNDLPLTSPEMLAVRRLAQDMPVGIIHHPAIITLEKLKDYANKIQFQGDPATANDTPNPFPPLYDRDVLGFFPFQVSDHHFVVSLYIMTRDMSKVYRPTAPSNSPTRYDMPPEAYDLTIGGVNGMKAKVTYKNPLDGTYDRVKIVSRLSHQIIVHLRLTDSPRLLDIQD